MINAKPGGPLFIEKLSIEQKGTLIKELIAKKPVSEENKQAAMKLIGRTLQGIDNENSVNLHTLLRGIYDTPESQDNDDSKHLDLLMNDVQSNSQTYKDLKAKTDPLRDKMVIAEKDQKEWNKNNQNNQKPEKSTD